MGYLSMQSDFCKEIGFTKDKFDGYLWSSEYNTITLSIVWSIYPGKGNFLTVLNNIKDRGYNILAYDTSKRMTKILEKFGFSKNEEYSCMYFIQDNTEPEIILNHLDDKL